MSRPLEETITCKNCGWQQPFIIWQSLNVTLDKDRKEELLNGQLTRFVCEKCQWSSEVVYSMLYHDMENKLMIWHIPGEEPVPDSGFPFEGEMAGYRHRTVRNRNDLIEKILIFETGFDDRVMEFLKLVVRAQSEDGELPSNADLLFSSMLPSEEGDDLLRLELLTEKGVRACDIPVGMYSHLETSLAEKLPPVESETGQWLEVDANYAANLAKGD